MSREQISAQPISAVEALPALIDQAIQNAADHGVAELAQRFATLRQVVDEIRQEMPGSIAQALEPIQTAASTNATRIGEQGRKVAGNSRDIERLTETATDVALRAHDLQRHMTDLSDWLADLEGRINEESKIRSESGQLFAGQLEDLFEDAKTTAARASRKIGTTVAALQDEFSRAELQSASDVDELRARIKSLEDRGGRAPKHEVRFSRRRWQIRFEQSNGKWGKWIDLTVLGRGFATGGSSFRLNVQQDGVTVNANAKTLNFVDGFTVTATEKGVDITGGGGGTGGFFPTEIMADEVFEVPERFQALYNAPFCNDGLLANDGLVAEVN